MFVFIHPQYSQNGVLLPRIASRSLRVLRTAELQNNTERVQPTKNTF